MESRAYYIYEWRRPDGTPFYVGMGSGNRYLHPKRNWMTNKIVRGIESSGSSVQRVIVYDNLTYAEALDLEVETIAWYGRIIDGDGGILTNFAAGGQGCPPLEGPSPLKGTTKSDETRRRMSLGQMGNTHRRGKSQTPEWKDHMSRVMSGNQHRLGKSHSPETKAKIAAASAAAHQRRREAVGIA